MIQAHCGIRCAWKKREGYVAQIVKWDRKETPLGRHYVLRKDGEWHEIGKGYVFTADDEFEFELEEGE